MAAKSVRDASKGVRKPKTEQRTYRFNAQLWADFEEDCARHLRNPRLVVEALVRSRKSPYLCKVNRTEDGYLEAEVISACDYLDPADGVHCTLHGRTRPDGRTAKPALCFDWPPKDEAIHRGCALATRWQRAQHR